MSGASEKVGRPPIHSHMAADRGPTSSDHADVPRAAQMVSVDPPAAAILSRADWEKALTFTSTLTVSSP